MHGRVEFAGVPLDFDQLDSMDMGADGWQGDDSTPTEWMPVGLTQIAIHPAHLAGSGTLDVDGLTSFVVPATDGTFPDIPHSDVEAILDYAHHLATFKQGGKEFQAGFPLLQQFTSASQDAILQQELATIYERYQGADAETDQKLIEPTNAR
jgi:hypothetical protein